MSHHHDVATELDRLVTLWQAEDAIAISKPAAAQTHCVEPPGQSSLENSIWKVEAETKAGQHIDAIGPKPTRVVNQNLAIDSATAFHDEFEKRIGTTSLPLLGRRQPDRQRAFLKIQDGCDAHCTYCIIPTLRPGLWSKPVQDVVNEANALVSAGHIEIVLTGIFLGAYGQPTALRRRQPRPTAEALGELVSALCTRVPGLRRLRLSSLEPGDLRPELISLFRSHPQVVPHFHLPLQSGSDLLLRRMNRQYTRDDFLHMVDQVHAAFDRPALTTDVVCGFPGETDEEFEQTAEVVKAAGFLHVHAFPYSPRPGTAAARWTNQFIRGPVVNERIQRLSQIADDFSLNYRSSFIGQTVEVIVERNSKSVLEVAAGSMTAPHHGRCERYFPVHFNNPTTRPGDIVRLKITGVTRAQTLGILCSAVNPVYAFSF